MRSILFLVVFYFSFCHASSGQDREILKGTSELRRIVLENYAINVLQLDEIRAKLDSLSVTNEEFKWFCYNLGYVSSNLYTGNLEGRQYRVEWVKENKIFKGLSERELAIVIDNLELLDVPRTGFWEERYPHKINTNSVRLKEISNYNIEKGDRILHYNAGGNHLCDILYLSLDSIEITHHPFLYKTKDRKFFEVVSKNNGTSSNKLNYPITASAQLDINFKYDKIVFDGIGILFHRIYSNFSKNFKEIHTMLNDDGELIMSCNYYAPPFDGPFQEVKLIDEKIGRVLKLGFKLKEKIHVENEYLVYKFSKDQSYD